jgi:beta-lactam-binding protein with PASTA domain
MFSGGWKGYLIHLSIIILLIVIGLFFFFSIYLPTATRHGDALEVPDLIGIRANDLESFLASKKLRYEIMDSTYAPETKPRTVLSQNPKAGSTVKEDRKIYLTISSSKPPLVKMPKLVDFSFKNAEIVLSSNDLKIGNIQYTPHYTQNVVLRQFYKNSFIAENTMIPRGSVIDLLVSSGESDRKVELPDLEGLSLSEAGARLQSLGLEVGSLVFEENQKYIDGTVLKQKPGFIQGDSIRVGQYIDLWVAGKDPRTRVPDDVRE